MDTTDSAGGVQESVHGEDHVARQTLSTEKALAGGPRSHTRSTDPMTLYLVRWRLREAMRRLLRAEPEISTASSVLVLCAAEGYEGTVLMDMGFTDVTVSDLSKEITGTAAGRDPRLKTLVLNAEQTGLGEGTYEIVVVQDGLHHLARPVLGFTEMLRIAARAVIFIEPRDSLVGRMIGTEWETHGPAVNYVFRWTPRMVRDVASSYLGRDSFRDLTFSFWHHNPVFAKMGKALGGGGFAMVCIRCAKTGMDLLLAPGANQICGLIVKRLQPRGQGNGPEQG